MLPWLPEEGDELSIRRSQKVRDDGARIHVRNRGVQTRDDGDGDGENDRDGDQTNLRQILDRKYFFVLFRPPSSLLTPIPELA